MRTPRRNMLAAAMALGWLMQPHSLQTQAPNGYPPRWSPQVELTALQDVDASLAADDVQRFTQVHRLDKTEQPRNCNDWIRLHAAGYDATEPDDAANRASLVRCSTLHFLKHARPAAKTHVRNLVWEDNMLGLLPAIVATVNGDYERQRVVDAHKAGESFLRVYPEARGRKAGASLHIDQQLASVSTPFTQVTRRHVIVLTPEAWGDFNADGFDDVAVSVVNRFESELANTHDIRRTENTRLFVFTRYTPRGRLKLLTNATR